VVARLVKHNEAGARVLHCPSSVVEPFIEPFAKRIGAQAIGTPIEIADGRVRMIGQLMSNEKKIEQVLNRLGVDRGGTLPTAIRSSIFPARNRRPSGGRLSRCEVESRSAVEKVGRSSGKTPKYG